MPINNASGFQRKQLSNHIAEHIRAEILEGVHRPGEFLRLDDIAQNLGVSVTPVREAFMALSVEGFVRHAERRGFLVSTLKRRDFEDLYGLLAQVAARLAERAATAITHKEIDQLRHIHSRLVEAAQAGRFDEVEQANDEFHRVINRTADSSKLAWVLLGVLKYVPKRLYANIAGMSDMLIEQHGRILKALEDHDPLEASTAMYEHEEKSMREVVESLEQRGLFKADGSTD
ncbi:GntR family transcriptional regulator [Nesterenkonia muleiensis]|uniref:GntR family transcriptional regulator n=1 Tax=Nesterenkonia muleiensis TaxID=2282648 RepID=UPI000E711C8A|nr:GntR family transcriptional regulator [Nesterenkonia muleiensis]